MRFRDLLIGQRFEFARPDSVRLSGLARGPWVKRSARTYYKDTSPFTDASKEWRIDNDHAFWYDHHNEVGTIDVAVEEAP
jgi:hypothetical protein